MQKSKEIVGLPEVGGGLAVGNTHLIASLMAVETGRKHDGRQNNLSGRITLLPCSKTEGGVA